MDGYFNSINGALNDSSLGFISTGTDTGTVNNYNIPTLAIGTFSGYNQGSSVILVPANTNTGASTLTIGLLGSTPIVDMFGNPLTAGALLAGVAYPLMYSGASFRLVRSTGRITYSASNTPVNGTFNVITTWGVFSGSAPIVSLASNTFTFNANCFAVLNGTASSPNTFAICNTNRTGTVGPVGWTGGAISPSGTLFMPGLTFYGLAGGTFQITAEGTQASPPTLTLFLTFFLI